MLRVDATARPGTLTNIADVMPGVPGLRPAPGGGDGPAGPLVRGGSAHRGGEGKRARAVVKVLARRIRPHFTG